MEHLVVCLPTVVADAVRVATSVDAEAVVTRCPIASRLLARCPSSSRWHHDGLWGHDSACAASGVTKGDTFVAMSSQRLHGGFSLAVLSSRGRRWSSLGQTRASGCSCFGVLSVLWSHSWVPACDGTGVCAEHCFHFVPDSVGFCGSRLSRVVPVFGVPAALAARGSSARELGVGWVAEAAIAPCVVSSSESEHCELL
ncbi:hypothetical protein Taro_039889 [Colocasia esculenta]|uniref:Uncharacterized protein n=1 Tax=Colocasia esculenta TaxID=4460 RepID=A0A843WH33_COLES|nr:hypothetical protein [Colocasia esculenta]